MQLQIPATLLPAARYPEVLRTFLPQDLGPFAAADGAAPSPESIFAIGLSFERYPESGELVRCTGEGPDFFRFATPCEISAESVNLPRPGLRHVAVSAYTAPENISRVPRALAALFACPVLEDFVDALSGDMRLFSAIFFRHGVMVAHDDPWIETARPPHGTARLDAAHVARGLRFFVDATASRHAQMASIADMGALASEFLALDQHTAYAPEAVREITGLTLVPEVSAQTA